MHILFFIYCVLRIVSCLQSVNKAFTINKKRTGLGMKNLLMGILFVAVLAAMSHAVTKGLSMRKNSKHFIAKW